jgi:Putative peptidoglycan binding domain
MDLLPGAWSPYAAADGTTTRWYRLTDPWTFFPVRSGKGYGCRAIKRELISLGYDAVGFGTDSPVIGTVAATLIREFQRDSGLTDDGIFGPATSAALFKPRLLALQTANRIPDDLLRKQSKLESALDPGCVGWSDQDDKGLVQVNIRIRSVTAVQAFDPAFALPYLASELANVHDSLGDWDGAIAEWNVGGYWARHWVAAGKPPDGAYDPKYDIDWYTRATRYVALVRAQTL